MSILARAKSRLAPRSDRRAIGPLGMDFALDSLHVVQLEKSADGPPTVFARTSARFDGPRRDVLNNAKIFKSLLHDALAADNFRGRNAVVAIPSGMFRIVSVNYKSSPGAESDDAAIVDVVEDRIDGNVSEFVIDYLPVTSRSKTDENLALVAICERQRIVEFLELARKSGLEVDALEIGPVAITRLVSAMVKESGADNILVLNTGRQASYLTLISGSDLLFDQEVSIGEQTLVQQAAETLDMPIDLVIDHLTNSGINSVDVDSESGLQDTAIVDTMAEILRPKFLKLVEEIKRVCLYAAAETRGGGVSDIYLLGGIARWPGSDRLLSSLTGFNVAKIPDPLALFPSQNTKANGQTAPEIAVATGAALRGFADV